MYTDTENKYSCKGVSKKQNDMCFKRYKDVLDAYQTLLHKLLRMGDKVKTQELLDLKLGDIDKAINKGFRVHEQGVMTYEQNKLGLSAYHDKRFVLLDGIHTRPLF